VQRKLHIFYNLFGSAKARAKKTHGKIQETLPVGGNSMRKFFVLLTLGAILLFSSSLASAQSEITLPLVSVQLWPEYDQPSMLVLTDFEIPADTALPVDLTFRIPKDANLIAVASYTSQGDLADAIFDGPTVNGDWKTFTVTMTTLAARFEYYDALDFSGEKRTYSYLWYGRYAVDQFNIRILKPMDTIAVLTQPPLPSISQENELNFYVGDPMPLADGETFKLDIEYDKTSNALVVESQGVQPSAPVDENTPGRVSLNNSLPYVIGVLAVIMIIGGSVYFWRSSRRPFGRPRRRSSAPAESEQGNMESYCSQCGSRARAGDRFCRTCGARLRHQEE
jgi:hypothetical protein